MRTSVPPPLQRFVELFNRAAYWESHEVLEEPWREGRSDFYKGLILYASAWVHVQRGNPRGIEAQLRKAVRHLDAYRPWYLGVDVEALLRRAEQVRQVVSAQRGTPAEEWEALVPAPRLELRAGRVRGDEPELGQPDD